jgi:glycosyltransferase involved in cell wall biosynthesis
MTILYITPLWSGLKSFFFEGRNLANGMPAFFKVFQSLINNPKVNFIYIILFIQNDKSKICIPIEFREKVKVVPFYVNGRYSLYFSIFLSIILGCYIGLKRRVRLVYGHGTISFIASVIGIILGIKNFRRIYGTFLYPKIMKKVNIVRTDFLEYLSFKLKSDGVIITNDGTNGDKVYMKVHETKDRVHFLLNGVDKPLFITKSGYENGGYFSYVARIDKWKRQDLLLEALYCLKMEGIDIPITYFVGVIYDRDYYNYLFELVHKYGLVDYIVFTGPMEAKYIPFILKNSTCTFSLYSFSNLGNVFLEAMASGAVMLAINERNSLDIVSSFAYCAVVDDPQDIANKIISVIQDESLRMNYRKGAERFYLENLHSWDQRVQEELAVLFDIR